MIYPQTIYADGGWSSSSYPFEGKVAQAVLKAVLRDIDAGRAGGTMFTEDGWEQTYENTLEFWYTQGDDMSSLDIGITPAYTETIAVLRQYGIVSDQRPLMTNRELRDLSDQAADQPIQQDGYELQTLLENPGTGGSVSWPADSVAEDGTYVVGGIGTAGMAAVAIGFAVLLAITVTHLPKTEAVSRD